MTSYKFHWVKKKKKKHHLKNPQYLFGGKKKKKGTSKHLTKKSKSTEDSLMKSLTERLVRRPTFIRL